MPLLRYRTGDFVEVTDMSCACGLVGRRITALRGRQVRRFRFEDGAYFTPTHLNGLFNHFPLREFQVTQISTCRIELRVEFQRGTQQTTAILSAIQAYVTAELNNQSLVDVVETVFKPGDKFQRYRSLDDDVQ